jgi:signal transduction histidine kinase
MAASTRLRVSHRYLTTPGVSGGQLLRDGLLAAVCLTLVLVVNLSGAESVPGNSDPNALNVALTVLAVGTIALRRRYPLLVLLVTLLAVLSLMVTKGTVGLATLGPIIAFYTAAAMGTRRHVRLAGVFVVFALALTALLRPVDLSTEGAVVMVTVFAGGYLLAMSARARRERALADVAAAEQRAEAERERAAHTVSQERLRITRELHDVIGHAMSVMVVQAGVAERLLDSDVEQAREAVAEIARTGRRSMAEMRQILGALREADTTGEPLPRSPTPTLNDLGALAAKVDGAGLPVAIHVRGVRGAVPAGIDLAAYRVVQEALTNCLKHSRAGCAEVTVTYRPTGVELEVLDDGRQLVAVPDSGVHAGHGLTGMRERVAIYDGSLSVGRGPRGGFRVHATFPYTQGHTS